MINTLLIFKYCKIWFKKIKENTMLDHCTLPKFLFRKKSVLIHLARIKNIMYICVYIYMCVKDLSLFLFMIFYIYLKHNIYSSQRFYAHYLTFGFSSLSPLPACCIHIQFTMATSKDFFFYYVLFNKIYQT